MTLNTLISCMHEKDHSIVKRSNVQSDVVVINQCESNSIDEFDFKNNKGETCHCKFICTTERGLSRSRNMAIQNAWGDICLICDDDEYFYDDYLDKILNAFSEEPQAAVIAFALNRKDYSKVFPNNKLKLGYRRIGQISSQQIAFKRDKILAADIEFDIKMGSGTGNGAGEENMFLHTCRRKKLKMFYFPKVIATILATGKSRWFKGFTEQYFENFGWVSRRIHGIIIGWIYITIWVITHRALYKKDSSGLKVYVNLLRGFFQKR